MEFSTELWWLTPVSVCIATVAMASGVGGAIFFSPLFIIALGLDAKVAIGTALITELFGFSSGLYAYSSAKLIDYRLGLKTLVFSIPFAIVGLYLGNYIPSNVLKGVFATGIVFIAYQIFSEYRKETAQHGNETPWIADADHETHLIDASGKHYFYTVCNHHIRKALSAIGGLFVGMISVGLGELLDYHLVSKCKVPTPVAVGTAIFTVVITVLVASLGHFYEFFFYSEPKVLQDVFGIIIFTIPGVLIGGQLGPRLQRKIPESYIKVGLSCLFVFVGLLMFYTLTK